MRKKTKISNHILIPSHSKLSDSDKKEVLEKFSISVKELPFIKMDDPAIIKLKVKAGDVIKIDRKSPTAGKTVFYRGVIA